MADYDFYGLDTRTFQQLVQAVSIATLAPGVVVYGDGPDGARDASFCGKVNYPTGLETWDGSLIVQAKFRQQRFDNTKAAGKWVLSQLESDLQKFVGSPSKPSDPKNKVEPPDFYLFVTNVNLTAVPKSGSYDKTIALLEKYKNCLGFRDFDVWDGNKLSRLLDSNREIATSYAGYVTTGDVLQKMHDHLSGTFPDFYEVMTDFLQKELIGPDRFARLSEAGDQKSKRSLASVFVDLPVSDDGTVTLATVADDFDEDDDDEGEGDEGEGEQRGFIADILEISGRKFDANSISYREGKNSRDHQVTDLGRVVLIGGPGQGKSTLGQFICQIFRAALLSHRDLNSLMPQATEAIDEVVDCCEKENFESPRVRRFPVRVDLKAFADKHEQSGSTLLSYITSRIEQKADRKIGNERVSTWLRQYPWVIVLDGLDEVPQTGNRADVIHAISEFEAHIASRKADVLIIATSRPQGYSYEFGQEYYWHRYLVPLEVSQALRYAQRLLEVSHPDDPEARTNILAKLEDAGRKANTRRLMKSPLQVTILAVLSELQGDPPNDRWELFDKYYQTIYSREVQKKELRSRILGKYRREIDILHRRIGLALQIRNEKEGRNDAFLSVMELREVIDDCLRDCPDPEDMTLAQVAAQIEEATFHRLVFLVSPQDDAVGFEIRSIQEFMAARALTDGTDKQVIERLRAIAPHPFWRNVMLFAAGKCECDKDHLISSITNLSFEMNKHSDNIACKYTLAGSQLALDLLEDATFAHSRSQTEVLLESALHLLDSSYGLFETRIVSLCERDSLIKDTVLKRIRERLSNSQQKVLSVDWKVLVRLISSGSGEAERIANEIWQTNSIPQLEVLDLFPSWAPTYRWISEKRLELAEQLSPRDLEDGVHRAQSPEWLLGYRRACSPDHHLAEMKIHFHENDIPPIALSFPKFRSDHSEDNWSAVLNCPLNSRRWSVVKSVAKFCQRPSSKSLSISFQEILKIEQNYPGVAKGIETDIMPWPMLMVFNAFESGLTPEQIAESLKQGLFGDTAEWEAVERTWRTTGISWKEMLDLIQLDDSFYRLFPFPLHVAPYGQLANYSSSILKCIESLSSVLKSNLHFCQLSKVRRLFRIFSTFSSSESNISPETVIVPPEVFLAAWPEDRPTLIQLSMLKRYGVKPPLDAEWVEALNEIGNREKSGVFRFATWNDGDQWSNSMLKEVIKHFNHNPVNTGLICWILEFSHASNCDVSHAIGVSDLEFEDSDSVRNTIDKIKFRLDNGLIRENDVEILSREIEKLRAAGVEGGPLGLEFDALNSYWSESWAMELMSALVERCNNHPEHVSSCIRWFENYLQKCPSPLQDDHILNSLGLHAY